MMLITEALRVSGLQELNTGLLALDQFGKQEMCPQQGGRAALQQLTGACGPR